MFGDFLNNKDKLQKKRYGRKVDEQGRYVETLEHIRGNAAIGEQVHSARTFKTNKLMTFDEMKVHWDEMNREAREWLDKNPGQAANFITSQGVDGNEITQIVPVKDLIFSGSNLVAIYDGNGNQIVGKDNIIREIQRRRAEQDKWIREGKIENVFDEVHHTDDGWTSNVRFTAFPNQLHPNEVKAEDERLLRIAEERSKNDKRKTRFLGDGVDSDTEETLKYPVDTGSKKPRTEEKGSITVSTTPMDIDQLNTSTGFKLLTDDKIEKASKDDLVNLIERIKEELRIREKIETDSSASFQTSGHDIKELKDSLSKAESRLESFQASDTTAIVNNDNKNSNVGGIVAVVGVISAFAIGGIALAKSKLGKGKKK